MRYAPQQSFPSRTTIKSGPVRDEFDTISQFFDRLPEPAAARAGFVSTVATGSSGSELDAITKLQAETMAAYYLQERVATLTQVGASLVVDPTADTHAHYANITGDVTVTVAPAIPVETHSTYLFLTTDGGVLSFGAGVTEANTTSTDKNQAYIVKLSTVDYGVNWVATHVYQASELPNTVPNGAPDDAVLDQQRSIELYNEPVSIAISHDGTKVIHADEWGMEVYGLATPYDITSTIDTGGTAYNELLQDYEYANRPSGSTGNLQSIYFYNNGANLLVAYGNDSDATDWFVSYYSLTTPYTPLGGFALLSQFDLAFDPRSAQFSEDGLWLFVSEHDHRWQYLRNPIKVYKYSVGTAFDLSAVNSTAIQEFTFPASFVDVDGNLAFFVNDVRFISGGLRATRLVSYEYPDWRYCEIEFYSLSVAYDLSTMTQSDTLTIPSAQAGSRTLSMAFNTAEDRLYLGDDDYFLRQVIFYE